MSMVAGASADAQAPAGVVPEHGSPDRLTEDDLEAEEEEAEIEAEVDTVEGKGAQV